LFCFCIFYIFIGVFQTTLGRLNELSVMQSVNYSHTNENRSRNIRSFAKLQEISQDVTDIQVGINERCSKHFIKKCKLHTSSILVCNHPNHMVPIHPAFKTSLASLNFPLKCWEETQRRIITNRHIVPKHDILEDTSKIKFRACTINNTGDHKCTLVIRNKKRWTSYCNEAFFDVHWKMCAFII